MKRTLFLLALLLSATALYAQPAPSDAVVPVPAPIVVYVVSAFGIGGLIYKVIDGLKNMIPALANNGTVLKIINFLGSFILLGGGCWAATGHPLDALDILKCTVAAALASLTAAGLYEAKKRSDMARAGGAASITNVRAVTEADSGVVAPPPSGKSSK